MNLNKPILTGWQASKTAKFIRKNAWFFRPIAGEFMTMYTLFFIYLPGAFGMLYTEMPWTAVIFIVTMTHLIASIIFIEAALEGTNSA